jgi:hypothetical protein
MKENIAPESRFILSGGQNHNTFNSNNILQHSTYMTGLKFRIFQPPYKGLKINTMPEVVQCINVLILKPQPSTSIQEQSL